MRSSPYGLGPAVAVVWTDASVPLSRGTQGTWTIELGRWAGSHARVLRGAQFDVPKALLNQVIPELRELFLLLHVRDETEIDLRLRHRRIHGLCALFDIPAHEAADRAGG